jgi:hypothetical protein
MVAVHASNAVHAGVSSGKLQQGLLNKRSNRVWRRCDGFETCMRFSSSTQSTLALSPHLLPLPPCASNRTQLAASSSSWCCRACITDQQRKLTAENSSRPNTGAAGSVQGAEAVVVMLDHIGSRGPGGSSCLVQPLCFPGIPPTAAAHGSYAGLSHKGR